MYRIRLTRHGPDHERLPHAPMLGGELDIETRHRSFQTTILFLVDTGATSSMATKWSLDKQTSFPMNIYTKGRKDAAGGIGGHWPTRQFDDATFTVLAQDDGEEVALGLELPSFSILAPWKDAETDAELTGPIPEDDPRLRNGEVRRCAEVPPLLGRDVFHANNLDLSYSTNEDAWITIPDEFVEDVEVLQERPG